MSGVFPLGERSGVNLRGEYGPTWEGVKAPVATGAEPEPEPQDVVMADAKEEEKEEEKMQVDDEAKKPAPPEDKKDGAQHTFIRPYGPSISIIRFLQHVLVTPAAVLKTSALRSPQYVR